MSERLDAYRQLEARLAWLRWKHAGLETPDEEALVDEMEAAWWQLSEAERHVANGELVPTLTSTPPALDRDTRDEDVWENPGKRVRSLIDGRSRAERGL